MYLKDRIITWLYLGMLVAFMVLVDITRFGLIVVYSVIALGIPGEWVMSWSVL